MLAYITPTGEAFHLSMHCPALNAGRAGAVASGHRLQPLSRVQLATLPGHLRPCYACARSAVVLQSPAKARPTADARPLIEDPSISTEGTPAMFSNSREERAVTSPSRDGSLLSSGGPGGRISLAGIGAMAGLRGGLSATSILTVGLVMLTVRTLRKRRN
jgi:hypothetical protein